MTWYRLYNLKNVENIHGEVLLLLKATLLHGCFSRFLNCTYGTKLRKASNMNLPFFIHFLKEKKAAQ